MCEICRKYKCPDGCPNNYTPRRMRDKKSMAERRWSFVSVSRIEGGRPVSVNEAAVIRKNNNEIISKHF